MRTLTALSLVIPIVLQLCILVLLLKLRLQKRFIWFFTYIAYELVSSALKLAVSSSSGAYFRVYWTTEIFDVLLTFAAVRESFLHVFWQESRLRWFRWVFWACITVALAYAGWKAWAYPPAQAGRLVAMIVDLEFAFDCIIAVIGLLYFALVALSGLTEHHRESTIIFGFGINATVAMAGFLTRSVFGIRFRSLSEWLPALAYLLAEIIWTVELLRPQQRVAEPNVSLERISRALDSYIELFRKYIGRRT
jgi:hypothetical protein